MILHGRHLIIKAGGTALAVSKSCEINISTEQIPVSSPNTGKWKNYIAGCKSWEVTTNHLVLSIVNAIAKVGTTVSIEVSIGNNAGHPFNGFVDNVTLEDVGTISRPDAIFWDTTRNIFVAKIGTLMPKYYNTWSTGEAYDHPSDYDLFYYNGTTYSWHDNKLTKEKLTGSALVTAWRATGTVGNLAQGSFSFLGSGALTPAT